MSMDYELKRSISDIQSGISRLDANARRRPARPGQQLIQRAAAQLARVCGDEALEARPQLVGDAAPGLRGGRLIVMGEDRADRG